MGLHAGITSVPALMAVSFVYHILVYHVISNGNQSWEQMVMMVQIALKCFTSLDHV